MTLIRSDMPECDQWAVAARMLEMHGDDVAGALMEQVQALIEAGDHQEVQNWLSISQKVQRLYVPDGDV